MSYQSFENLSVWKRACDVAEDVYRQLSNCRDYGLKDQMQRAAVSIASNIAEGSERETSRDFIRFLNIAKGSAAELRTQIYIAQRVGILTSPETENLLNNVKAVSAMLHALAKSINKRLNTSSSPLVVP